MMFSHTSQPRLAVGMLAGLFVGGTVPAAAVQDSAETIVLGAQDYENATNHTIDMAIPTAPGLTLAGASTFDGIDHNLGSDLSYDFGVSESGTPEFGVSLRPYWAIIRPAQDRARGPNEDPPDLDGDWAWLRQTQFSIGLTERKIGSNQAASAGAGFVFYPFSSTNPRTDSAFRTCISNALQTQVAVARTQTAAGMRSLTVAQINEILTEAGLKDPAFRRFGKTPQRIRAQLVAVLEGLELSRDRQSAILLEYDTHVTRLQTRFLPNDAAINAILRNQGISNPGFARAASPDLDTAARNLTSYLNSRSDAASLEVAALVAAFQRRARHVAALPAGPRTRTDPTSAGFINAFLTVQGVDSPTYASANWSAQQLTSAVVRYVRRHAPATPESTINEIRAALVGQDTHETVGRELSDSWMRALLLSWGVQWQFSYREPADNLLVEIETYLNQIQRAGAEVQIGQDPAREMSEADIPRLADAVMGVAGNAGVTQAVQQTSRAALVSARTTCASRARERYALQDEFIFGVGAAWRAEDTDLDNLDPAGVSAWVGYRLPFGRRTARRKDGTEYIAPVGNLNLSYRRIADESVPLSASTKASAETDLFALALERNEDNRRIRIGSSFVDREFEDPLVSDQSFWRFSFGYEQEVRDGTWLFGEIGDVTDDSIFSEGQFYRFGVRFETPD